MTVYVKLVTQVPRESQAGSWALKVEIEMGNNTQSFCYYNFIYTTLGKLID